MSNTIMLVLLFSEPIAICICFIYEFRTTGWSLSLSDFKKTYSVLVAWWFCITYCLSITISSLILLQWALLIPSACFTIMCSMPFVQLIKRLFGKLSI